MPSSTTRVLLVGDVMLDLYWQGSVDRISPEAPVPVLSVDKLEERLGGAANVAANLSTLGSPVTLLSPLGRDDAGASLQAMMASRGIGVETVSDEGYLTTRKIRCVSRRQQLLRADFETRPTPAMLTALARRFDELLPKHDMVVLSDYAKGALQECAHFVRAARECGKPVLVDPKGRDYTRYAGATLVKPNYAEFLACVGDVDDEEHFCRLGTALRRKLQIEHLLVTRGEAGMSLFQAGGTLHQRAQTREVYDVCGAGDTVLATLAHAVGQGKAWPEAMRWANAAAGIVVGRFGTSQVSFAELEDKLREESLA